MRIVRDPNQVKIRDCGGGVSVAVSNATSPLGDVGPGCADDYLSYRIIPQDLAPWMEPGDPLKFVYSDFCGYVNVDPTMNSLQPEAEWAKWQPTYFDSDVVHGSNLGISPSEVNLENLNLQIPWGFATAWKVSSFRYNPGGVYGQTTTHSAAQYNVFLQQNPSGSPSAGDLLSSSEVRIATNASGQVFRSAITYDIWYSVAVTAETNPNYIQVRINNAAPITVTANSSNSYSDTQYNMNIMHAILGTPSGNPEWRGRHRGLVVVKNASSNADLLTQLNAWLDFWDTLDG